MNNERLCIKLMTQLVANSEFMTLMLHMTNVHTTRANCIVMYHLCFIAIFVHNCNTQTQLIEDTHTSIDMFRHGWRSRYVNEPGEHLSHCTHQPNSIAWRVKQVR
jgi:hypothetical protein